MVVVVVVERAGYEPKQPEPKTRSIMKMLFTAAAAIKTTKKYEEFFFGLPLQYSDHSPL